MTGPGLILHVGHGKTGSSALQAALAVSIEALAAQGIAYPVNRSVEMAAEGQTSWGNTEPLKIVESYRAACAAYPQARHVLLSSEMAFGPLRDDAAQIEALRAEGVAVRQVLFIRDPLAHALSAYNHTVRRNGETDAVGVMLRRYKRPARVAEFLTRYRALGVPVEVANYSRHRKGLLARFESLIGAPPGTLTPHPARVVNRSLTPSEIMLQRRFNQHWGGESRSFVANPLCDELPEVPVSPPRISREDYDAFAARVAPMLAAANALIARDEAYVLEPFDEIMAPPKPDPTAYFRFNGAQLNTLVAAISARIPQPGVTEAYFDVVAELQQGRAMTRDDLEVLTRMGFALRPGNRRLLPPGELPRAAEPGRQSVWRWMLRRGGPRKPGRD